MATFTLTVATSADAFIARSTDEPPQAWASAEEQALFFRDVEAADWAIMGRNTHQAADETYRRRIIFSSKTDGWQRRTQFWLDPTDKNPDDLARAVALIHPLENGLILGGTRVHDWFLDVRAIHKVLLTIEPVAFATGLPIFSDQTSSDATLNAQGTRYLVLSKI